MENKSQNGGKRLLGKTVVITGAAGGMGHAMAKKFGQEGAKLLLLDITEKGLQETRQTLHNIGFDADTYICDVSDIKSIENCASAIFEKHGAVDCLINNAGILPPATPLEKLDPQIWDRVFSINVRGAFLCAQQFGLQMLQKKSGSIVNIASIAATFPLGQPAYTPAKAAILALARQIAVEWGPHGLRANSVSPGMIMTPMTTKIYEDKAVLEMRSRAVASRRIGKADDIAAVAAYLCSDDASYINGQDIVVDGGFGLTALMRMQPLAAQPQPPY